VARYFPIFLDLEGTECLVVGAGEIATGKAAQLLKYGARLTIVAPRATQQVLEWAKQGRVRYHDREFQESDLDGKTLVVGSTDRPEVNRRVYEAARSRNILANIVDVPELCSFIYGAVVERGDLQIAISTSGRSPAYAAHLRRELENQFGEEYAEYVDILGQVRRAVRKAVTDLEEQKNVYARILQMDLLSLIRSGRKEEALKAALECISPSSD
jgi:precorrin-2 dehydrogenase/sirohydrochlorin ferrochelatase